MARPRREKPPLYPPEFIVKVTDRNRESLEKKYGIVIGNDACYIVPPNVLSDFDFWEWSNKRRLEDFKKQSASGEKID